MFSKTPLGILILNIYQGKRTMVPFSAHGLITFPDINT